MYAKLHPPMIISQAHTCHTHPQHGDLGCNLFRAICFPLQVNRGKVPGQNLWLQPRLENKNFISLQQIVSNLDEPSNKGSSSLAAESEPLGWQSSSINCFDEGKKWRLIVDLVDHPTWLQFPCTVSCPRESYSYLVYLSRCYLKIVTYCQCKSDSPLFKKMWFYY